MSAGASQVAVFVARCDLPVLAIGEASRDGPGLSEPTAANGKHESDIGVSPDLTRSTTSLVGRILRGIGRVDHDWRAGR